MEDIDRAIVEGLGRKLNPILLAHGSCDAAHAEKVRELADKLAPLLGESVGIAFLDDECLPQGAKVLPMFLGEGQHVSKDVPELMAKTDCVWLPSLAAYADEIAAMAVVDVKTHFKDMATIFVLYRMENFEALKRGLDAKASDFPKHAVAALYGGDKAVLDVVQDWQQQGITNIVVRPMLLFAGHSLSALQTQVASIQGVQMGSVLCNCEAFPAWIADCFRGEL